MSDFTLQNSVRDAVEAVVDDPVLTIRRAVAVYDVSVDGGEVGSHVLTTTPPIPAGAFVIGAFARLLTPFADDGGTAEVSLGLETADDLLPAGFTLNGSSLDAPYSGVLVLANVHPGAAASWLHPTAERSLVLTVAVEAVTAGVLAILLLYMDAWGDA